MQENISREIIEEYKFFIEDYFEILSTYYLLSLQSKMVFKDNNKMREILKNEVMEYINGYKKELKIYKFLLKNEKKLYINDIYRVLNDLTCKYEEKRSYTEEVFENFETAIGTELAYKFYLPRNKPKYTTDEDIEKYKIYAMGYNIERVKDFLVEETVYEENILNNEMKKVKEMDVDINSNIDMFGVFENGKILTPKIKDELSTLVSIHELVHNSLILNKDKINNNDIVYGDDLPIFYELLFQSTNDFSKIEIHKTDIALKLLESYEEEPFNIQIEKVKKLVNL